MTPKIIAIVGSSTAIAGRVAGCQVTSIVADVDVLDPASATISPLAAFHRFSFQSFKDVELRNLGFVNRAIGFHHHDLIADLDLAGEDAADREAPDVVVVVEIGDEQLQRVSAQFLGGGIESTICSNKGLQIS